MTNTYDISPESNKRTKVSGQCFGCKLEIPSGKDEDEKGKDAKDILIVTEENLEKFKVKTGYYPFLYPYGRESHGDDDEMVDID